MVWYGMGCYYNQLIARNEHDQKEGFGGSWFGGRFWGDSWFMVRCFLRWEGRGGGNLHELNGGGIGVAPHLVDEPVLVGRREQARKIDGWEVLWDSPLPARSLSGSRRFLFAVFFGIQIVKFKIIIKSEIRFAFDAHSFKDN